MKLRDRPVVPRFTSPPFCIQIELTEGCNLRCAFCGLQGIRESAGGPYNFLTLRLAHLLAKRIAATGWNPRLEFAMHGEPTMNPDAVYIISTFRAQLPRAQLMMTSNGGGLLAPPGPESRIRDLFDAGLNILALDNYDSVKIVPKILAQLPADFPISIVHYPGDPLGNPHPRRRPTFQMITVVQDISAADAGTHATLNNHAGSAFPLNKAAEGKPCAKPFRELSIRWDGHVALCCNDWPGVYQCGSLVDQTLENLWFGEPFEAARRYLQSGRREFAPCRGCDATSYRPGLLPDPRGQTRLPDPTPADAQRVQQSAQAPTYTRVVPRPWQRPGEPLRTPQASADAV